MGRRKKGKRKGCTSLSVAAPHSPPAVALLVVVVQLVQRAVRPTGAGVAEVLPEARVEPAGERSALTRGSSAPEFRDPVKAFMPGTSVHLDRCARERRKHLTEERYQVAGTRTQLIFDFRIPEHQYGNPWLMYIK